MRNVELLTTFPEINKWLIGDTIHLGHRVPEWKSGLITFHESKPVSFWGIADNLIVLNDYQEDKDDDFSFFRIIKSRKLKNETHFIPSTIFTCRKKRFNGEFPREKYYLENVTFWERENRQFNEKVDEVLKENYFNLMNRSDL